MKNWLKFTNGFWVNGVKWEDEGYVYIDPIIITAVQKSKLNQNLNIGCLIYLPDKVCFAVKESPEEVIAMIQSAL